METVNKETMNDSSSRIIRPGGFIITNRALSLCGFGAGAKILDLGCGPGATVEYLRDEHAFEAWGINTDASMLPPQPYFLNADAVNIPLPSSSMDGIIMECSFSMMKDQQSVLFECHRLLKPGGKLIISDMYSLGEPAILNGCLGRIDSRETILSRLESAGFSTEIFEDFSSHLRTYWGQAIFEKGAVAFYCGLGCDAESLKRIQCGYFLLVALKKEASS